MCLATATPPTLAVQRQSVLSDEIAPGKGIEPAAVAMEQAKEYGIIGPRGRTFYPSRLGSTDYPGLHVNPRCGSLSTQMCHEGFAEWPHPQSARQ